MSALAKRQNYQFHNLSDYELVKHYLESKDHTYLHTLYYRYEKFVYKHWTHLIQSLIKINNKKILANLNDLKQDFLMESYCIFQNAINYVDISKIYNPSNWKFLGVYGYYLNNLRRSFRNKALKENLEVSIYRKFKKKTKNQQKEVNLIDLVAYEKSAEDVFFEKISDIDLVKYTFTDSELALIQGLQQNKTIDQICKDLGCSVGKFYKIKNMIKRKIEKEVQNGK